MKVRSVCALAGVGMLLTSVSVYSLTPAGSHAGELSGEVELEAVQSDQADDGSEEESLETEEISRFVAGDVVQVDARLAHAELPTKAGAETFVYVEVKGDDQQAGTARPKVHLALVLDRSGSMAGERMKNAKAAARAAVDRLNDGDTVSVLAFDTRVQPVLRPTVIGAATRAEVAQSIEAVRLGGDTCISCGIESAMVDTASSTDTVDQILVLSDGQANNGLVTMDALRGLATRARSQGSSITTIGVSLGYNEETLGALALESNGRHHFVQDESDLPAVFQKEADILTGTVASGAEAVISLAPGVELSRVVDRSFDRQGDLVRVPLGSLGRGEVKTVLLAVRAPIASPVDAQKLASVQVQFANAVTGQQDFVRGELAAKRSDQASVEMDPVVATRVQRTETADALRRANELFRKGDLDRARRTIRQEQEKLAKNETKTKARARKFDFEDVDDSFGAQKKALDEAREGFQPHPPGVAAPDPFDSPAPKRNVANEMPMRF